MNQFTTSLWGDEGFSAILSMKSLPEIIKTIINDTSPPLWNINEWLVFNALGTAEIYIRGLAFFYFLIAVFFVYKIGSFLWDKKTGLLSAVLVFLNPFFFIYAFEGRMYSILAAGVTASMYFFLKILNTKNLKLSIRSVMLLLPFGQCTPTILQFLRYFCRGFGSYMNSPSAKEKKQNPCLNYLFSLQSDICPGFIPFTTKQKWSEAAFGLERPH